MEDTSRQGKQNEHFSWLYPELLSKDSLVEILNQRYVRHSDLENLAKEDLVELYYKYVIPLPQRKYRMNRRGKEMTKKQIRLAKKRRLATLDTEEPAKKKQNQNSVSNTRFITSFNDPSKGENRLKPPPSCIDFKKKTIKLGSSSKKPVCAEEKVDDGELESPSAKKKIKLITFSSSSDSTPSSNTKATSPSISPSAKSPTKKDSEINRSKTISLINKHLATSDSSSAKVISEKTSVSSKTEEVNSDKKDDSVKMESSSTQVTKKKIKIARIPWP